MSFSTIESYCQELTLYVIPPKRALNWASPRSLLLSYAYNQYTSSDYPDFRHPMGHVIVELKDNSRKKISGTVARNKRNMAAMVMKQGHGLGILFVPVPGRLEDEIKSHADINARLHRGDIALIKFKLNQTTFEKLWSYWEEYICRGYDSIYNGLNKPREGKGAGCSAFAISFLEIAELLHPNELQHWVEHANVPEDLIGLAGKKHVPLSKILLRKKWANILRERYQTISYYTPDRMFAWVHELATSGGGNRAPYQHIRVENARCIVIDCSKQSVSGIPIWIERSEEFMEAPVVLKTD